MPLKADQLLALFPNPVLTPILGEPDHESIRILQKEVNKNLAAIPSNLGCGTKGLLCLSVSNTVYSTISSTPVVPPPNPGSAPSATDIDACSSAMAIASVHATHELDVKLYEEYCAADRLSVKLLSNAVEDIFIASLADEHTGYSSVTTKQIFQHLNDEYCEIDDVMLIANQARISAAYDPNLPIETLWTQISEAVAYAEAGKSKFTKEQILNAAVAAVTASGVFQDDIKKWKGKAASDQTYANFKPYFMKAHRSWRASLRTTAGNHFPRVNSAATQPYTQNSSPLSASTFSNDFSESLANLATATSADRATVATLSDTVATLSAQLADAQAKLVSSLLDNQKLLKQLSNRGQRTSGGAGGANKGDAKKGDYDPWTGPKIHYCFKHGFQCPHPSFRCPDQNPNHVKNATKANTMGGNQETYKAK